MKQPIFSIYQDAKEEWRFRLKAKNGEIIAIGEGYKTKQGCIKGVESVRKSTAEAMVMIGDEIISGKANSFTDTVKKFIHNVKSKFRIKK